MYAINEVCTKFNISLEQANQILAQIGSEGKLEIDQDEYDFLQSQLTGQQDAQESGLTLPSARDIDVPTSTVRYTRQPVADAVALMNEISEVMGKYGQSAGDAAVNRMLGEFFGQIGKENSELVETVSYIRDMVTRLEEGK